MKQSSDRNRSMDTPMLTPGDYLDDSHSPASVATTMQSSTPHDTYMDSPFMDSNFCLESGLSLPPSSDSLVHAAISSPPMQQQFSTVPYTLPPASGFDPYQSEATHHGHDETGGLYFPFAQHHDLSSVPLTTDINLFDISEPCIPVTQWMSPPSYSIYHGDYSSTTTEAFPSISGRQQPTLLPNTTAPPSQTRLSTPHYPPTSSSSRPPTYQLQQQPTSQPTPRSTTTTTTTTSTFHPVPQPSHQRQIHGHPLPDGTWRCAHPGCTSTTTFRRACDLRKHFTRHRKHLFCRHEGCPQATRGGFSSSKDRARHEAKHNPGVLCEWKGCGRVFSRVDNMKDHVRRIHRRHS